MARATEGWLERTTFAPSPTPTDLLEFFGIPPDPEDQLESNIRTKRKVWKGNRNRSRGSQGIEIADQVLERIKDAEHALLRGGDIDVDETVPEFRERGPARSIDEIFDEIESLLFRAKYEDALDRIEANESEWGQLPRFKELRARVVLDALERDPESLSSRDLVEKAISDARASIVELGPDETRYSILIDLLDASGDPNGADSVFRQAEKSLDTLSPGFLMRDLKILTRTGNTERVVARAVELAESKNIDDDGVSSLVQVLLSYCTSMLPLRSESEAAEYQRVVSVAAWAATGVAEAENATRSHRMWAATATQLVFSGNWMWRALFALLTGFVGLPILNRSMSKPAYQILIDGPADSGNSRARRANSQNRAYVMVTRSGVVETVHERVKLPWQQEAGAFPSLQNLDELFDFMG